MVGTRFCCWLYKSYMCYMWMTKEVFLVEQSTINQQTLNSFFRVLQTLAGHERILLSLDMLHMA